MDNVSSESNDMSSVATNLCSRCHCIYKIGLLCFLACINRPRVARVTAYILTRQLVLSVGLFVMTRSR